jgi:hypothetical protein
MIDFCMIYNFPASSLLKKIVETRFSWLKAKLPEHQIVTLPSKEFKTDMIPV